ncbi:WD repeat-containing and planar cell polarity effector protein fritz homolog [Oppia nitens]|uniref:WD repeat-containing and planar cell polarity effector protein fritz homolog n=1 Tax=Oppia nitens TaxID=1686743 RepID=UPI0023D9E304|nr:WD repeat-containing and planar cell polarity effector protein fritz homolog [Oppia nitens]
MVNIILNENYMVISYTQSKLTLVAINRSSVGGGGGIGSGSRGGNDKTKKSKQKSKMKMKTATATTTTKFRLTNKNTEISTIDLECGVGGGSSNGGANSRRVDRNLIVSQSGHQLIVWWQSAINCVGPWSAPRANTRQLANVLVYSVSLDTTTTRKLNYISYAYISGHIFQILLSTMDENQVILLQQSSHSQTVVNYSLYEINESIECLQQIYSIRIPLLKCCLKAQLTQALDKVVMLLDDESIAVFNIQHNALYSMHSSQKSFDYTLNPLDAIFTVTDQLGKISVYDYAFNTIAINYDNQHHHHLPNIRLIRFPILMDSKGLTNYYLKDSDKSDEAIASLQTIPWNRYSDIAYYCLNYIFNYLIKQPFNGKREAQLETTLATFLSPIVSIDDNVLKQYNYEIHLLAKRYFYHLVRNDSLDKAYLLAVDLDIKYLYHLLYKIADKRNNQRIASAALNKTHSFDTFNNEFHKVQTAFMLQI